MHRRHVPLRGGVVQRRAPEDAARAATRTRAKAKGVKRRPCARERVYGLNAPLECGLVERRGAVARVEVVRDPRVEPAACVCLAPKVGSMRHQHCAVLDSSASVTVIHHGRGAVLRALIRSEYIVVS